MRRSTLSALVVAIVPGFLFQARSLPAADSASADEGQPAATVLLSQRGDPPPREDRGFRLRSPFELRLRRGRGTGIDLELRSPVIPYYRQLPDEELAPPEVPTEEGLARMSREQLLDLLRHGAEQLDAQLDPFATGDTWRDYLRLRRLQEALGPPPRQRGPGAGPPAIPPPPTEENLRRDAPPEPESADDAAAGEARRSPARQRRELGAVFERFEAVAGNPEYEAITELTGFRTTHAALAEYLKPPLERQRNLVSVRAEDLGEALDELSGDERWSRYLEVDRLGRTSDAEPNVERLQAILEKYERVSRDRRYRAIAQLRSFEATRRALNEYVAMLRTASQPSGTPDLPAPPE